MIKMIVEQNNLIVENPINKQEYLNFIENFPFSLFLLQWDREIENCNSVAELYLNKPRENLLNQNFFNLFQLTEEKIAEFEEVFFNIINLNLSEVKEFNYINHNDEKSWVEIFLTPVNFENQKLIQIIMHDITEKKLAEKIIKRENKKLRELNHIKKELLAKTSEELKNPLNIMANASNFLLNSYKDKLDQNAIQLLELIKNGGAKSMKLVSQIVDISRIESLDFELNKKIESLSNLLKNTVESLVEQLKNPNIKFNLNILDDLYSDIDILRIQQVFYDLLSMMIKKTSNNSISISISVKKENEFAKITFCCTNKILSEKKRKKLFSNKSKSMDKDLDLGIQYSKELIDLHGGEIFMEPNDHNNGTKFIIKLPVKDWTENLIHLFVFHNSGILLCDHKFQEQIKDLDSTLISGSLVGMSMLLKEIFQGDKDLKIIDHGDLKIIFERNRTNDITFAMIVKENLFIINRKLKALISEFDEKYKNLIDKLEETVCSRDNWESIENSIIKYFENN